MSGAARIDRKTTPGFRFFAEAIALGRRFALVLALVPGVTAAAAEGPAVVVVLVDGLSPGAASEMPRLAALARSDGATSWSRARAVMPSVTNTNYASILTGVYAETHGITGNYFWDRTGPPRAQPLELAEHLETQTVFTVAARVRPKLRTAGVFGKGKHGSLFAAGDRQSAPGTLWVDEKLERTAESLFGADTRVMTEAIRVMEENDPAVLFVALAAVDLASHAFGPESEEASRAAAGADREIGRFVDRLRDGGRWVRTILFVTADHSFTSLVPSEENPKPMVVLGRSLEKAGLESDVFVVADGTLAHVYRRSFRPPPGERQDEEETSRLARAARILGSVDAVEAVLTPGEIRERHPDWRVSHPRMGDLVVLARPDRSFNDPDHPRVARFLGHHGGPRERPIPMLVAGGHPWLREGTRTTEAPADNADLGATVFALHGLAPSDTAGTPLPETVRGRILIEAFDTKSPLPKGRDATSRSRPAPGDGASDRRVRTPSSLRRPERHGCRHTGRDAPWSRSPSPHRAG